MLDPRLDALAEVLIGFSTNLQRGERFLIDAYDVPQEIVIALIRSTRSKGAFPFVNLQSNTILPANCFEAQKRISIGHFATLS